MCGGDEKSGYSSDSGEYKADFESFWLLYPRKVEKKRTYRVWKVRVKEGISPKDIIEAALNYSKYCREKGTDTRYIKHPATFLGPDKPFEEFIGGMPEKLNSNIPRNVSDALRLVEESESGEGEVALW